MSLLEKLKGLFGTKQGSRRGGDEGPRRKDPPFGGSRDKDIDKLPPERAAELAGHAPEHVDT